MNIEPAAAAAAPRVAAAPVAGCELLTFSLGTELYGVDILKVQEIRGYEAALQRADEAVKRFSAETLPELRRRLEAARRMHDAVKP